MKLTSTAARDAAGAGKWLVAVAWVAFGVGCVSNPTPHPSVETTDTARVDDMVETPTDEVGCDDIGGFWDGTACFATGGPDVETSVPEGDAEVTDGDDTVDATDTIDTAADGDPGPSDDTGR